MSARTLLAVPVAALALAGCGEKDEPEPDPAPANLTTLVEKAARQTLAAGPSEISITVHGNTEYTIDETLDPDSGWYLANEPPRAPGKKFAVRWPPITGPAFGFGGSDTGRAYTGPIGSGRRSCWVEAHRPAGQSGGAMSAEEALVTSHTILNLLTREVAMAMPGPVLADGSRVPAESESYEAVLGTPDEPSARLIVAGLEENRIGLGVEDGQLTGFAVVVAKGESPLTFTPNRPESAIVVNFTGIGEGDPVREPECLAIE
jgi:hypothetical protein